MFLRAHGRKSMPVCLETLLFFCPFVLMFSALAARYGISPYVLCFGVLPESTLCQNGKQVEIITKMIFELCYIEAIYYYSTKFAVESGEAKLSRFQLQT